MRIFANIIIFMMLASQFAIATHAYEHDLHEAETHHCAVCLKLNPIDDSTANVDDSIVVYSFVNDKLEFATKLFFTRLLPNTPIRSPPFS